jgi:predicted flavoprotein YhiN
MSDEHATPLVIIGAGAAGLMAACHAGACGVPALLLERKHRPGSKLLMCGNGRCNLTSCRSPDELLADFGSPLDDFLRPAIRAFSPAKLQRWFEAQGLPLMRTRDGKVFPKSERAPDVVKCLSDIMRRYQVPVCYNAPVASISQAAAGFMVHTPTFEVNAQRVLIATGGVSYPKTGSVGDGQHIAGELGPRLQPYRPGLVGIAWQSPWLATHAGQQFKSVEVRVFDGDRPIGETSGLLECERWGLGGGAISNATRLLSRANASTPGVEIRHTPGQPPLRISPLTMRPLKEAMVTVGGVDLDGVSPATLQSTQMPGLFFAGEVLDVDGPTGGYNLTAAFATARLAVDAIAREGGFTPPVEKARPQGRQGQRPDRRRKFPPHGPAAGRKRGGSSPRASRAGPPVKPRHQR